MTDLRLYEIAPALRQAVTDEEFDDELVNSLVMSFKDKAYGIACITDELNGLVEMAKVEEKRIAEKRRFAENRITRIKAYLQSCMEDADLTTLEIGTKKIALQKNPPKVVIEDEQRLPAKFIKIVQTQSIDKTAIKTALQSGEQVDGAKLEQGLSLRIK